MATSTKSAHWGVLAQFENPAELFHACEAVRDGGFKNWDAHTPFPVHGLDDAMGLKPTPLPWIVLASGMTGLTIGTTLQWWVHSVEYPLVLSGKPLFAWPAYVPIIFELSILFSAFAAVLSILGLSKLPMWNHPLFASKRFERVTDDKFFISIESIDPKFDTKETADFLRSLGASHVELVE